VDIEVKAEDGEMKDNKAEENNVETTNVSVPDENKESNNSKFSLIAIMCCFRLV
jgi:hypothetical protein